MEEPFIRLIDHTKIHFLKKHLPIHVDPIILSLSKTCRYLGHVDGWYSNAEHSMLVANCFQNDNVARFALIHDFAEYVFGDMPSPVKALCPEYKRLIDNFQQVLEIHFCGEPASTTIKDAIKYVDRRIGATEQKYLRRHLDEWLEVEPYNHVYFYRWTWELAFYNFKQYFKKLFPEYIECTHQHSLSPM